MQLVRSVIVLAAAAAAATAQPQSNRQAPGHVAPQATSTAAQLPTAPAGPNRKPGAPTSSRVAERTGALKAGAALNILVYDNGDPLNGLAATAAQNVSPFGTTVGTGANFNTLLTGGGWDVVAVDCPNTVPTGDWGPLISYVNSGGRVVLSFWNWDAEPALTSAFDASVSASFSWNGQTLADQGTSGAFLGATMPNSDWADQWSDDGDEFTPLGGAIGLANIGSPSTPVMVWGNGGRTIAAPVFDEAGATWLGDGSGVRIWENLILMTAVHEQDILVYDTDTVNHLALEAAFNASPGGTHVADQATLDAQLAAGPWDAVLLDMPNVTPTAGFNGLINYVNNGGHVALSFWDWDSSSGTDPLLSGAFDVLASFSFSWNGTTLFDSGTTAAFAGVSMPNTDWADNFFDDGDEFVPQGVAAAVAHIGNPGAPVMVWGNEGRTLAAPVLDEAGPTWLQDGIQVWTNVLSLLTEPKAACTPRFGVLGTNPAGYDCTTPPVVGGLWVASVSTTPTVGTQTLTTFVTLGLGGPIQGVPFLGYELLMLPPYLETTSFGTHNIPVPVDPLLVGQSFPTQAARLELAGAQIVGVLLNGQDVTFGF